MDARSSREVAAEIMAQYLRDWFSAAQTEQHQIDSFTTGQCLDMIERAVQGKK